MTESREDSFANGFYLSNCFLRAFTKITDQYDYKLISTQPGYGIAIAHTRDQARRYLPEQHVTDVMAKGIIEQFEIVQINEQ